MRREEERTFDRTGRENKSLQMLYKYLLPLPPAKIRRKLE
jgi:hypothetical protein